MHYKRVTNIGAILAVLALVAFCIPTDMVGQYLDRLAPDGDAAMLDRLPMVWIIGIGRGLALLALAACVWPRVAARLAKAPELQRLGFGRPVGELLKETLSYWRPQLDRQGTLILAVIILLGLAIRIACISQPMREDESYTYLTYISKPIRRIVTLYNLPNNHILYSVLGRLSLLAFGLSEWAIRLPALLAGVALIPLSAAATERLYSRHAALWAALLVSLCPYLVFYSTNARGYSLVMLCTVAILCLILVPQPSWLDWLVMALLAALGMFTVPTMLFALLSLALYALVHRIAADSMRARYLAHAGMAALLGAGLTLLLWSGILRNEGVDAITSNPFVRPLAPALARARLWQELRTAWLHWHGWHVSVWTKLPLWVGFGVALGALGKSAKLTWGLVLSLLAVLSVPLLMHTAPPPRSWSYAAPLYLMVVAAGWDRLVHGASGIWSKRKRQVAVFVSAVLVVSTLFAPVEVIRLAHSTETRHFEFKRLVVDQYLWVAEGDRLMVVSPYWTPVRFYMLKLGFPESIYLGRIDNAKRLVFLVGASGREAQLAAHRARLKTPEQWSDPEPIMQWQHIELWAAARQEP